MKKTEVVHDDEQQGVVAQAKRWGLIIGLVATLVGLPGTIISLYAVLHKKPDTALYAGSDLKLSYDPETNKADVAFTFAFTASNSGNADDVLVDAYGYLEPRQSALPGALPPGRLPIKRSAFKFIDRDTEKPLFMPFSIVAAKSRDIQCVVSIDVSAVRAAGIEKRLIISLWSKDRRLSEMSFCFAQQQDTFSPGVKAHREFLTAQCN